MGVESQRKTGTAGPEEAEGEPAADAKAQGTKVSPGNERSVWLDLSDRGSWEDGQGPSHKGLAGHSKELGLFSQREATDWVSVGMA